MPNVQPDPAAPHAAHHPPRAQPPDVATHTRPARHTFEALFHAEFATMHRLAHLLGAADPEDVAQEAFARLHARWSKLDDPTRAGGYLRVTVLNLVRSAGRRKAVARQHDEPDRSTAASLLVPSAERSALDHIGDRAILGALHSLSRRHREALVLRFWLDLTYDQLADAMSISVGTAKSHVSRGISALRATLDSNGAV